ncbi:MAG TPA: glutamate-5-semialdehyde dehydrogenase [Candidatus Limnocylindrales bacterium]|nr:glutamate-5-semialdehyde dehydrogenase [Candidatus Limnocylindrales bacterium]
MKNQINLNQIKDAALILSQKKESDQNMFLKNLANSLMDHKELIFKANRKDIRNAEKNNLSTSMIQRLILDEDLLNDLILRLGNLQKLKSVTGTILEEKLLKNKLILKKVSVPLGVILVIYESRPEVTIDVAALCIKSGNAVILKGGSEAINTNRALHQCVIEALDKSKLSKKTVTYIEVRIMLNKLLNRSDYIDLVIARGGYGMVKNVMEKSRIPVLAHSAGGARIYIDESADLSIVEKIIINSKTSKPAACNSLDTILIHQKIAKKVLLILKKTLKNSKVGIVNNQWEQEFLDLKIGIKIVKNLEEAIKFINIYSKKHSEGIIAQNKAVINKFKNSIDIAAVFINCSTRFHDGYEFGMGAEMGISTGKLHARGPVGLKELTTYKWEVYGNGQIR